EYGVKKLALLRESNGIKDPLYYYRFDIDMPGDDHPGNFHSSELWFFFETLAKCWRPFTGKYYDLARQMCNYWCNFIKTGDPNGKDIDGTQMPKWLPYKEGQAFDMIFKTDGPVTVDKPSEDGVLKELIGR
nr:carboxylesterase family protein [Lachnospiraceae bacterium]